MALPYPLRVISWLCWLCTPVFSASRQFANSRRAHWIALRNASQKRAEETVKVRQYAHTRLQQYGSTSHRQRFVASSRPYTVVGGSSSSSRSGSVVFTPRVGPRHSTVSDAAAAAALTPTMLPKVAVVSVRPDGPSMSMLSVLYVLDERVSTPIALGMAKHLDNNPADGLLRATVMVHNSAPTGGVVLLKCAFAMLIDVHAAALSRLVCHADGWHARKAMASQQLDMTLKLDTPGFSAHVNFTSEAISSLLPRARVSVCLDLQYFNFIPKRDFDEWAFANELMGVDRIYAPDQLAYRWQVSSQAARGFVVPSHDFPHRYVGDGQRDAYNTTYSMKERSDAACNYLCLHEHWYDDWVGVAWTPDEYLTFENMGVPPPAVRTDLVSNAISGYLHVLAKSAPAWPFCVAELCVVRPFYAPSALLPGESSTWTLPGQGLKVQYSTSSQLAIERYIRRYYSMPKLGSVKKCFVHPDYRLGTPIKLHGFRMVSCPDHLAARQGCLAGHQSHLRRPCFELCGFFGQETCTECVAPPAPGCGAVLSGSMDHMKATSNSIMEAFELAHFRVAPIENTKTGFRDAYWLSNMSRTIGALVAHSNLNAGSSSSGARDSASSSNPLAEAYLAEAERLISLVSKHVPAPAVAGAWYRARRQAVRHGVMEESSSDFSKLPSSSYDVRSMSSGTLPATLDAMRQALQMLEHELSQALWQYGAS